jgi:putative endonuclease
VSYFHINKRAVGTQGEMLAREYLKAHGHTIVDHNFSYRFGEIDLITRKDKAYHFVEVKFRRTHEYGLPQEAVVRRKQSRIRRTSLIWLRKRHLPLDSEMHFDVLGIHTDTRGTLIYEFIEDAF